ncbi:hypothetical protein BLL52_2536 [Rhodoferax antarcticus ANT.BR]|uniref:Uncharacterized protein n=1 Tax=Rhodoferax antarcticus ANT.BR TaxID=1111071 RepID=A0A1Q8YEB5_9BURK|nr:hypothetical protein BLL52_2536 [Rhodoferax antarcticus ANT.BR]
MHAARITAGGLGLAAKPDTGLNSKALRAQISFGPTLPQALLQRWAKGTLEQPYLVGKNSPLEKLK